MEQPNITSDGGVLTPAFWALTMLTGWRPAWPEPR
jgi:hypothetical protein